MEYLYRTKGVCSRSMRLEIEDGVIRDLRIEGGCHGNAQGLEALVRGQRAEEVRDRLRGIQCGNKPTSCPDQLAHALEEALSLAQSADTAAN